MYLKDAHVARNSVDTRCESSTQKFRRKPEVNISRTRAVASLLDFSN